MWGGENSNSKTLILKDSSVRSIWTYLTASPCYTTNKNKHDNTQTNIISTIKQLREGDRQTETETDRQTRTRRHTDSERQTQRERETERERQRQ